MARGLCARHGGGRTKVCNFKGCKTLTAAQGRCVKHGAHGWCKFSGCTLAASSGFEHCVAHGGKKRTPCSVAGCTAIAVARDRCCKHGAHGWCKVDGCFTPAARTFEHCIKHGGRKKKKPCSVVGCTTTSVRMGLCWKHGRTKVCRLEGCATSAMARDLCCKYGAYGWCKVDGCSTPAARGFEHCIKHGGGKKKPCSVAGCTTTCIRKGLCWKHGGRGGECRIAGCTTISVTKLLEGCVQSYTNNIPINSQSSSWVAGLKLVI